MSLASGTCTHMLVLLWGPKMPKAGVKQGAGNRKQSEHVTPACPYGFFPVGFNFHWLGCSVTGPGQALCAGCLFSWSPHSHEGNSFHLPQQPRKESCEVWVWAGETVQLVECLLNKHHALGLLPQNVINGMVEHVLGKAGESKVQYHLQLHSKIKTQG